MEAIKLSAMMKMAIVDELSPNMRAIVYEIGLSDFSSKPPPLTKTPRKKLA